MGMLKLQMREVWVHEIEVVEIEMEVEKDEIEKIESQVKSMKIQEEVEKKNSLVPLWLESDPRKNQMRLAGL